EGKLAVTPRYSFMLFSISTTLVTLNAFDRSLSRYLAQNKGFFTSFPAEDIPGRIAFLLHLLTYREIPNGAQGDLGTQRFRHRVDRHANDKHRVLASQPNMEAEFRVWSGSNRRFHKRLWAALRDYLKQHSEFHGYFRSSLRRNGLRDLADVIDDNQNAII